MMSSAVGAIGQLIKVLFVLALIALVAWLAWKYRATIQQALQQLLSDLRRIWERLFGKRGAAATPEPESAQAPLPARRSFASFTDPFARGVADRWTTVQIVHYTFAAIEAWAEEQGCGRAEDQTPLEFAQHLSGRFPEIGPQVVKLADLYSRVAYGHQTVADRHRTVLQQLWRRLPRIATPPPVTEEVG